MSQNLPNMFESTLIKVREMMDANTVVGTPITTGDVTIIPISKVSMGFGGGGSDYNAKAPAKQANPFGGGAGVGVKVDPVCFLICKGESVRMMPVASAPSTTVDRVVEMLPDVLDKLSDFIDSHKKPSTEEIPVADAE